MYETRWADFSELSIIVSYWKMMADEMNKIDHLPELDIQMPERVKKLFKSESQKDKLRFRVAVDNYDRIVACAGGLMRMEYPFPLAESQSPFGWVISVYTLEEHRNNGLAHKLVDEVCFWLKEKGAKRARLWASYSGKRIYKSLGFTQMKDMSKPL